MYCSTLTLINYRGAQNLALDLEKQLNVFVGVNGVGKSSILDATAIALSWFVNRLKKSGVSGRGIAYMDITNGRSPATIGVTCNINNQNVTWNLMKARKGHSGEGVRSVLGELTEVTKSIQSKIEQCHECINLPLLAYYPVNRSVLDIPLRIRNKHHFDLLAAYEDSLTSGANFREFFEWFRDREDLENEHRKYLDQDEKPVDFQFPDPHLEAVRKAVAAFIPGFGEITVRRNPLRMEVRKHGKLLRVEQLSDGEKCLFALVGDLARRLAIANPSRTNALEGEGIILIDEIDLHLHPKWQRLVVPQLLKVFPNCQFIVSTHSPHVVTHVQPENLFLLSQDENGITVTKPVESYGKNVDRVLEDFMGLETTRPDEVFNSLNLIYELVRNGKLNDASDEIDKLQQRIGSDGDLAKARVLIKRKELIGR